MANPSIYDKASELNHELRCEVDEPGPSMRKALECIEMFKQVIHDQQEAYRIAMDRDDTDLVSWLDRNSNDPLAANYQGTWVYEHHKVGGVYACLHQSCSCCVEPGTFYSTAEYEGATFATAREAIQWARKEGDMWDKIHRRERAESPPKGVPS